MPNDIDLPPPDLQTSHIPGAYDYYSDATVRRLIAEHVAAAVAAERAAASDTGATLPAPVLAEQLRRAANWARAALEDDDAAVLDAARRVLHVCRWPTCGPLCAQAAECETLASNAPEQQRAQAEARNAARYLWAKPILSGDDDKTANARTLVIGEALMRGAPDLDAVIDAAIQAERGEPPHG